MSEPITMNEAILLKALMNGSFEGPDNTATLTVKGFVGANIIAARVALTNMQDLSKTQILEIVKFLKDAENALDMLEDKERE